jgi:hypothetical protein
MVDLRISYPDLESTRAAMGYLTGELQNLQAAQSRYDAALGSGEIAGAMGAFAGNWNYHRKVLLNKMQNLDKLVTEALSQFKKKDEELGRELRRK